MSPRFCDRYGTLRPEDAPPAGLSDAREALAAALGVPPAHVAVTAGGAAALTAALTALTTRGRKRRTLLAPRPGFPGHLATPGWFGYRVSPYPFDRLPTRSLGSACAGVLANAPHNPTGHVYETEELNRLCRAASRAGAWVVVDESFAGLELDGEAATLVAEDAELVRVSALNKRFPALTDERIGYVVASPSLLRTITLIHRTFSVGASIQAQRRLVTLLGGPWQRDLAGLRRELRSHRRLVHTELRDATLLRPLPMSAGLFMRIALGGGLRPALFASELRRRTGLWCAPAESFGAPGERWVRLRIGIPRDVLIRQCAELRALAETPSCGS